MVIDDVRKTGCGYPTQKKVRCLLEQLYKYAAKYDLITRDYARYLDIDKPKKIHIKKPFTVRQINKLWRNINDMPYEIKHVLMLLYSGCRISEYRHIRKSDVKLNRRFFVIRHSKTEAGSGRYIPIPKKLIPWYEECIKSEGDYICSRSDGSHHSYDSFRRNIFNPVMKHFKMKHTPHETRHTLASMLDSSDINRTVIKLILGHSLEGITERVYTHKSIRELLKAIDRVCT
jgi:integrase